MLRALKTFTAALLFLLQDPLLRRSPSTSITSWCRPPNSTGANFGFWCFLLARQYKTTLWLDLKVPSPTFPTVP
ncbi:hypothetical protein [Streptomyces subrutilus]|uniref:hypothetical protein n=1 Tax=Streptomyces subrutilus TaxID=36818 RepID=UPI0033DA7D59